MHLKYLLQRLYSLSSSEPRRGFSRSSLPDAGMYSSPLLSRVSPSLEGPPHGKTPHQSSEPSSTFKSTYTSIILPPFTSSGGTNFCTLAKSVFVMSYGSSRTPYIL